MSVNLEKISVVRGVKNWFMNETDQPWDHVGYPPWLVPIILRPDIMMERSMEKGFKNFHPQKEWLIEIRIMAISHKIVLKDHG